MSTQTPTPVPNPPPNPALPSNLAANPMLNRWVTIDAADTITVRSGKVELGQGIATAMAALAAKELGLALGQVRVEAASTAAGPDEGYTAGSFSIEHGGLALRYACAQVRSLFETRAAAALGTNDMLHVTRGIFARANSNEGVSYWQLRGDIDLACSAATLPAAILRSGPVDQNSLQRSDLPAKFTGAGFIQDLRLPGMLYGRVLRPGHPKDRLAAVDLAVIKAQPGVTHVVLDGGFVGVVAARDEDAVHAIAKAAKSATWTRTADLPAFDGRNGWMDQVAPRSSTTFIDESGSSDSDGGTHQQHAAAYSRPYLAHAAIGPSCAIAQWSAAGTLQVWSHSQGIYPLRRQLVRAFGLTADAVQVSHVNGAGCYGHNGADDVALDAALLARAAGSPVMCLWSRADELSWSPFGAAMRMKLAASLDAAGQIISWQHDVWSPPHLARPGFGDGVNLLAAAQLAVPHAPAPDADAPRPQGGGDRNAVPLYKVGRRRITHHLMAQGPLRSSAMRTLGAHGNIFAIDCFMDELAAKAGIDPVRFRLNHLDDPRLIGVLTAAAELARWTPNDPGGEGRGRGVGMARYKNLGSFFAVVAEVEVTDRVRLIKVSAAVDAGQVVHRDGLINQIEGGIIQAASWTLKEQAGWSDAGFTTRSWADYPILAFSETPEIAITIVERPGDASLGVGECAAGPVAAAIGNAVTHAIGVRVRDLPLTPDRIQAAIHDA
jgi:nicotinate dehydrogenase subunit B